MYRWPLFQFAASLDPNVLVQCIAANTEAFTISQEGFPSARRLRSVLTDILFTVRRGFYKVVRIATVVRKSDVPNYELYFRNSVLSIVGVLCCNQLE